MTPTIYLASPIDQGTNGDKGKAREVLLSRSCAVFDPSAGWTVPKSGEPSPSLQKGNFALMRQCDAVLALLHPGILTIGVVLEIQEAIMHGMPVQVYAPDIKPSWSLAYLGLHPHSDLELAVHYLVANLGGDEL